MNLYVPNKYIYTVVFLYTFGQENKSHKISVIHGADLISKFVLQSVKSPESIFKLRAVLPAYNATVLTTFKHDQSLDTLKTSEG